jgi:hypothetical protein
MLHWRIGNNPISDAFAFAGLTDARASLREWNTHSSNKTIKTILRRLAAFRYAIISGNPKNPIMDDKGHSKYPPSLRTQQEKYVFPQPALGILRPS